MLRVPQIILLGGLAYIVGCGPESNMTRVSGTVTVDGEVPAQGSIAFIPLDGAAPTTGAVIDQGKYTSEAPLGESKVEIRVAKVVGKKKLYDTPDSPVQEIMQEVLPAKYNESTELRSSVARKAGTATKDIRGPCRPIGPSPSRPRGMGCPTAGPRRVSTASSRERPQASTGPPPLAPPRA